MINLFNQLDSLSRRQVERSKERRKGGRERGRERREGRKNFPVCLFKHFRAFSFPAFMASRASLSVPFSQKNNLISILFKVPVKNIKILDLVPFEASPFRL